MMRQGQKYLLQGNSQLSSQFNSDVHQRGNKLLQGKNDNVHQQTKKAFFLNEKSTTFVLWVTGIAIVCVFVLLIWNIIKMNNNKDEVCSLEEKCITQPPQTNVSPEEALQTVDSIKNDKVEGFLDSVDDTSEQDVDTDAELLSSLIKADIKEQKDEGIENPVINIDRLIEDAKSSFKNSDAIVALIQQRLQKSADDFEVQEITPTPFINYENILQQKDEQIQNLQEKNNYLEETANKFIPDKIITPTPFIDYRNILQTRDLEIKNLKSDIQSLQERNKKIDEMLEERQKEIVQKKTEIQEIKKSKMSKQKKIREIKLLIREKNRKIDEMNELVSIKNSKINENNKTIDDINQLVTIKENKITSLTNELGNSVPKVDFDRLKEITKEGNEEIEKALKEMLGLKALTVIPRYGSSPIPNDSIFPKNLGKEEGIISTDKERFLVYQSDGNIVSYDITKDLKNNKNGTYSGTAVWASNTSPYNKNRTFNFYEWDKVKLKPEDLVLEGNKFQEWWYRGRPRRKSKKIEEKYNTKMSQNFDNNSIDITYEVKKGSNWVKIL